MSEQTVLCYGDSNTWGYNPATKDRFGRHERWTGVLRRELSEGFLVIEEGLNGRTTVWDDPMGSYRNGREYLAPCLGSHKPVDLVIIMLGTNDLKQRFSVPACDVAAGAGVLVDLVAASQSGPSSGPPQVLLIAPPPLARLTEFAEEFEGGAAKSRHLAERFRQVAQERGCAFLDAGQVIVSSDLDGIHLEQSEHAKLGRAVAARVREILSRNQNSGL